MSLLVVEPTTRVGCVIINSYHVTTQILGLDALTVDNCIQSEFLCNKNV
ncbi:hypothetical protein ALT721_410020 [Alteromonas alvinellae]